MWENRPAVYNAINSPCQNCQNRKVPKTCEKDCEKWQKYKQEKSILDKEIKDKRTVTNMFIEMYNDAKKKRERK